MVPDCRLNPSLNLTVEDLLSKVSKFEDKTVASDYEEGSAPFGDIPKSRKISVNLSINSAFEAVKSK